MVYASSSSVYGSNKKVPYSTYDKVDNPVSLYAATKKINELMTHAYSKLYNIPSIGLRFFTVYGPADRPDMAYFGFKPSTPLREGLHHSDRGVQYCCDAYVATLKGHGIAISMTEDYKPTDNAIAERINGIIKTELSINNSNSRRSSRHRISYPVASISITAAVLT